MERYNTFKRFQGVLLVWFKLILITLLIFVTPSKILAHKINIFAYVEGDTIFSESYFNNGRRCINSKIEVFDSAGNALLEGRTDDAGEFSFKVPGKTDLRLVLTAGMGHRAEYIIHTSELPGAIEEKVEESVPQPAQREIPVAGIMREKKINTAEVSQINLEEIESVIEEVLNRKLRPLMKLMTKSQENRVSSTEVIGGLGYIIGIMGIIMYFRSRKR